MIISKTLQESQPRKNSFSQRHFVEHKTCNKLCCRNQLITNTKKTYANGEGSTKRAILLGFERDSGSRRGASISDSSSSLTSVIVISLLDPEAETTTFRLISSETNLLLFLRIKLMGNLWGHETPTETEELTNEHLEEQVVTEDEQVVAVVVVLGR